MMKYENNMEIKPLFDLCFGKVPAEELFDKTKDPDMIHNLANDPAYHNTLTELRMELDAYLEKTNDPRHAGLSPWDNYNFDKPDGKIVKKH